LYTIAQSDKTEEAIEQTWGRGWEGRRKGGDAKDDKGRPYKS